MSNINRNTSTFIIFTYNQDRYIRESILSVEHQSVVPDQLIVIDDGSTDCSSDVITASLEHSKIKSVLHLTNEINIGFVPSFNLAIKKAESDVVLIQAGDDISRSNRLSVTLQMFEESKADLIYTSYEIIDENGGFIKSIVRGSRYISPFDLIKKGSGIPPYGMAIRKRLIRKLQVPIHLNNEDDYISMVGLINGPVLISENICYSYRTNPGSISGWSLHEKSAPKLINKFLNDQRNRTYNYLCWKSLLKNKNDEIIRFIDKRIDLSKSIENLPSLSLVKRLIVLFKNAKIVSIPEIIILLFGLRGIRALQYLRRLKAGI